MARGHSPGTQHSAHHPPRFVPWRLDPSDRIDNGYHLWQGGHLDRMVEPVLERVRGDQEKPVHGLRVHYGERNCQRKLFKK